MRYTALIRPWHAPRVRTRRRVRRYGAFRMIAMAFMLSLILSLYTVYYGAYVYWVALVTVVYVSVVWPVLGIRAVIRYTVRKHAARRYAR